DEFLVRALSTSGLAAIKWKTIGDFPLHCAQAWFGHGLRIQAHVLAMRPAPHEKLLHLHPMGGELQFIPLLLRKGLQSRGDIRLVGHAVWAVVVAPMNAETK